MHDTPPGVVSCFVCHSRCISRLFRFILECLSRHAGLSGSRRKSESNHTRRIDARERVRVQIRARQQAEDCDLCAQSQYYVGYAAVLQI